ncbi:ubiquitin carboxyl-terminal hydrolase 33 isoform X2 [Lingula anatina]|uniref:Ubiquitin carboxyl-terminal hydrolase n=1 Tax=Lingula anatina TaxID=7574 RepID=A0A1S3J9Z8_LINAN|nr:ubiquitin carboxyl-terminal hydrolase 33 isoform X2 [Lingula anatina]|eukprot:XP_013407031.1 ubiquitin carboxyl-terminal hydrolase 33 isoform X2 [Lingula anatina]
MGRKNPKRQKEKLPLLKKGNRKAKTCREKDKEKPLSNENGENTHPRAVKPETDQPSSALLLSNEEDGKVVCRTEPGLRNKGNTCFMNAAIQALLSCPPFAQYLTDSTVAKGNTSPSMFRCFKSLVEEMVSSRSHVVDPEDFFRTLCEMFPKFGDKQQQDCQNFTRLLLQLLKTELQYPAYDKSSHQLLYNSIIQDIFAGKLRTTMSCRCNKPRVYEDPIYELPLSVCKCQGETPNQKRSLEEAIHLFFMEIPLQRQSCGCSTETVKTDIIYLPEILVILLNWIHGRSCATGHFSFPLDNLSFQQYMPNLGPQDNITTYDLVAVVEHSGTPKSGHYKAYGKRHDEWYCFDDDSVEQVEQGRVETSHPYILFYRKVLPSQVYISKEWLFKQKMFVDPGPIDNAAVLCEHGNLRNEVAGNPDNFLKELSYEEFNEYFKSYKSYFLEVQPTIN